MRPPSPMLFRLGPEHATQKPILNALHTLEEACFPPRQRAWSREELAAELAHPHALVLAVGPAESEIHAYAAFREVAGEAELLRIATAPANRRQGLGAALLAEGLERLEAEGTEHFFLEVRADNGAAIALYQRFDFTESGRRRSYYPDGCDAVLMAR